MSEENDFHKQTTQPGVPEGKVSPELPPVPKEIGPYKIETFLDKGGMSILYLGAHPESQEPTVIKVLSPKYLSRPEVIQHFLKEAEIISMANHPNIVKLYGQGEWEKGLYIAMEFIEGISLRQYLLQTPISLKHALELIIEISYALCHLHTHGVIHRDLKPENILVTQEGAIKVIDFGIAQLLTEQKEGEKPKQRLIGTPIYISPEQRDNPQSVNFPSDIYSLGIISYELILGKLSHGRIHLSLMPKGMQKILTKALQPKPEDRYQDIVDFITDVTNYMNSENFESEKKVEDQLAELSENLQSIQTALVPKTLPEWDGLEIGVETLQATRIAGLYYDFFRLPDKRYVIILSESTVKGAESVVATALFRGIVRSLSEGLADPLTFVKQINQVLLKEQLEPAILFNCIVLDPDQKQFQYLSCGAGRLFVKRDEETIILENKNLALGIEETDFELVTEKWSQNETLMLPTFILSEMEEKLKLAIRDNTGHPVNQQLNNIIRQLGVQVRHPIQEHPVALIGIRKKD